MKSIIRVNAIAIVIGGIAAAQVAPTKSVPAAAMQTHQVFLAGGETTSIPLTIDAPARGSEWFRMGQLPGALCSS